MAGGQQYRHSPDYHLAVDGKLGISAHVLSNTIEPQHGTLGLFEINAASPFYAYRELGGDRIRLMVPAHEWLRVQEIISET